MKCDACGFVNQDFVAQRNQRQRKRRCKQCGQTISQSVAQESASTNHEAVAPMSIKPDQESTSVACIHCGQRLAIIGRDEVGCCPGCQAPIYSSGSAAYCSGCRRSGTALTFQAEAVMLGGRQSLYHRKRTTTDIVVVCQRCGRSVACSSNMLNPYEALEL